MDTTMVIFEINIGSVMESNEVHGLGMLMHLFCMGLDLNILLFSKDKHDTQ